MNIGKLLYILAIKIPKSHDLASAIPYVQQNEGDYFAIVDSDSRHPIYHLVCLAGQQVCYCTEEFFRFLRYILPKDKFESFSETVLVTSLPPTITDPATFPEIPTMPLLSLSSPSVQAGKQPLLMVFAKPGGRLDRELSASGAKAKRLFLPEDEPDNIFLRNQLEGLTLTINRLLQIRGNLPKELDLFNKYGEQAPHIDPFFTLSTDKHQFQIWRRANFRSTDDEPKWMCSWKIGTDLCRCAPEFLPYVGMVLNVDSYDRFLKLVRVVGSRKKDDEKMRPS